MSAHIIGDCPDCSDGLCTMNCGSALLVTGTEWIAASIWVGVFPTKATAAQVAAFRAKEPAA
jgi:hypothetical protein